MACRDIRSILVVDDDRALLASIEQALSAEVKELHLCADRRSAMAQLRKKTPDLVLLDLALPDGNGFEILKALHRQHPTPMVIAISGTATPEGAFDLAQHGVSAYLAKPFDTAALKTAIDAAASTPVDIQPHLRSLVGQRGLHSVEAEVRGTMLQEALARAANSRRGAARLLQVSRQLIQHMIKRARA